jgi:hypothetical protein
MRNGVIVRGLRPNTPAAFVLAFYFYLFFSTARLREFSEGRTMFLPSTEFFQMYKWLSLASCNGT